MCVCVCVLCCVSFFFSFVFVLFSSLHLLFLVFPLSFLFLSVSVCLSVCLSPPPPPPPLPPPPLFLSLSISVPFYHILLSLSCQLISLAQFLCLQKIRNIHKLKCRYVHNNDPLLVLQPVKEEEMFLDPWIVVYHDVMSDSEINDIKTIATPRVRVECLLHRKQVMVVWKLWTVASVE